MAVTSTALKAAADAHAAAANAIIALKAAPTVSTLAQSLAAQAAINATATALEAAGRDQLDDAGAQGGNNIL